MNEFETYSSEESKPIHFPKEPVIGKDEPKSVIFYNGRIFEIHYKEVMFLANKPKLITERIRLSIEKGMFFMYPDGTAPCHYCKYASFNIPQSFGVFQEAENLATRLEGTDVSHISRKTNENSCNYISSGKIKWANDFKNPEDGAIAMVQRRPCIIEEAIIEILVENEKLDRYEVFNKEFDYLTVDKLARQYDEGTLPEKFIIKRPN